MVDANIHVPGDGKGARDIYVDGELVKRVVYANVDRGIVRYHDDPPERAASGDCFVERTRYGKVEVVLIGD